MISNRLSLNDVMPLTCSRSGNCCHGKIVRLNPWELAIFSKFSELSPKEFRDRYCLHAGCQIRFEGSSGWKNQSTCSLYNPSQGCIAHLGRPLACRLYPLGRERQGKETYYMFQGKIFPCLDACPEVVDLPLMSIENYLEGQGTIPFETAQDAYLEVMQDLAEWAFTLLLETGLGLKEQTRILKKWRALGKAPTSEAALQIPTDWLDLLVIPEIPVEEELPLPFIQSHSSLLQEKARSSFSALSDKNDIAKASSLMMGIALLLARGLGADPASLAKRWCQNAMAS